MSLLNISLLSTLVYTQVYRLSYVLLVSRTSMDGPYECMFLFFVLSVSVYVNVQPMCAHEFLCTKCMQLSS